MKYVGILSVLFAAISGGGCQFLACDMVHSQDCTVYDTTIECGTNGITYDNSRGERVRPGYPVQPSGVMHDKCYFAKAQCIDKYLHVAHHGQCQDWESSTAPPPGSGTHGEDAIMDFFCTHLSHRDCDTTPNEVCATDGKTYLNHCEYDKARCTHRDLHVDFFGLCFDQ